MIRGARLAGVALVLTAPALVLPRGDTAPGDTVMGPGVTRQLSVRGDLYYDMRPADEPSISDTGRFVAFQQEQYDDGGASRVAGSTSARTGFSGIRVWRRDLRTDALRPVSAASGSGLHPSISANGRRIAYTFHQGLNWDIVTAYLDAKGVTARERVTGLTSDLPYQRTTQCQQFPATEADVSEGPCGPVLSGDGRSLALPVTQSIISPQLHPSIDGEQGSTYFDGFAEHGLALVRFFTDEDPDTVNRMSAVVRIRVLGSRTLHFGVTQVSGAFSRFVPGDGKSCVDANLDPGDSCVIGVEFEPDVELCGAVQGMLTVRGSTPAAQTMIGLVGEQRCETSGGGSLRPAPAARAADCPPASGDTDVLPLHASQQTVNFRELDVGSSVTDRMEVTGDDATVEFTASDCSIQLVSGGDIEEPSCAVEESVDLECIAHVRYQPTGVGPSVATLRVVDGNGVQVFHYVGTGRRSLVVMRRDPTGAGFTAPGAPAPRIVSVDESGEVISGAAPSLSYDGRHVAFVSGSTRPFPGTQPAQVFVHDTDASGDGTWVSGDTTNVSIIDESEETIFAEYAGQPSLSGDGSRVAFVEVRSTDTGQGWFTDASSVYVRDLSREVSVLASNPPGPPNEEPGLSYSPSLSRDGSTVAFSSSDFALIPDGVEVEQDQVYVRDLAPDFDEAGEPRVDTVSVRDDDTNFGQSGNPAISGDGGVVAFASSDALAGDEPESCCGYDSRQVFTRARFPSVSALPSGLFFPPQQLGTTGPSQAVTITNDGPGPAYLAPPPVEGFEVTGGCSSVLHRGESCELLIAPHPVEVGEYFGVMRVGLSAAQWEGDVLDLELVGVGVPPVFSIKPVAIEFGEQPLGIPGEPVAVRVRNVGDLPISLVATVVGEPLVVEPPEDEGSEPSESPSESASEDPSEQASEALRVEASAAEAVDEVPPPDFLVTASGGGDAECVDIAPGEYCRFLVAFDPQGLGDRIGQLVITVGEGDVPILQLVDLAGTTAVPELSLSPTVAREGRVIFVTGSNFLPGVSLQLDWSGGPLAVATITPDALGTFTAPVVVLPGRAGTHTLSLTMPDVGTIEAPPVVVVAGSLQPPDFVTRN